MSKLRDLHGLPFDRLTVVERGPNASRAQAQWWCECQCGTRCLVARSSLLSGLTRSCGCLRRETLRNVAYKHGLRDSPEYVAWSNMRRRCYDTKNTGFHRYGARGITVCEAWKGSFEAFYNDMGPRPSPQHSLERRNNNAEYSPENCCWRLKVEQQRNTSRNRRITLDGVTKCLAEWLEMLGIGASTYKQRIKRGWSREQALLTPINTRHRAQR